MQTVCWSSILSTSDCCTFSIMQACIVSESTCAFTTTAEGSGLELAIPGERVSFTITARDLQECLCSAADDLFTVEFTEDGEEMVAVNVSDKGAMVLKKKATLFLRIQSKLSVLLGEAHIEGSLFVVNILPVSKFRYCFNCGSLSKTMIYYRTPNGYSAFCPRRCNNHTENPGWIKVCGPC